MHLDDHTAQLRVADRPGARRAIHPGVEPGAGHLEDPAEPLDAVGVAVLGDEPEAAHRIVSLAK
jgi:hypothetical protein